MFSSKKLRITIETESTAWTQGKKYILSNLRMDVNITKVFSEIGPTAKIKIYGLSEDKMNQMTILAFKTVWIGKNIITIEEDSGGGYNQIFYGYITESMPDYSSVPDYYLRIEASAMAFENAMNPPSQQIKTNAASFKATENTSVASLCKFICQQYGKVCNPSIDLELKFVGENPPYINQDGLGARLSFIARTYKVLFVNTPTGINAYDSEKGSKKLFSFTPQNYIGYPILSKEGIFINTTSFRGLEIADRFRVLGSAIASANGYYCIGKINYKLQSEIPNGKWEANIYGFPIGGSSITTSLGGLNG